LPKTWNNAKILMRKTFVDSSPASNFYFEIHSLEEEPTIASPIVPNILQEVDIKQEKEIVECFEEVVILNVPCIIQDNNDHNEHILANELDKDEVELRMTQIQEGENAEIMHIFAAPGAYIRMALWADHS
jgi:hypothetical protein